MLRDMSHEWLEKILDYFGGDDDAAMSEDEIEAAFRSMASG